MNSNDVIIVGGGPAGVAAAVQLRRCGIEPLLFERDRVGGLVRNAFRLENYPGFPGGVAGGELADLLEEHLASHEVEVRREEVTSADVDDGLFRLESSAGACRCKVLIVASGTRPKRFNTVPVPPDVEGKVFYEVYPIAEVGGKKVVIVGAGDAAFDYALNLARSNDVFILNRRGEARCLPLLEERAARAPRIDYRVRTEVSGFEVGGEGFVGVKCSGPTGEETIDADYVLFALGREPERRFVSKRLDENAPRLEAEGRLYFVGDVRNGDLRQAAIAAGDGVRAALKIYRRREGVPR